MVSFCQKEIGLKFYLDFSPKVPLSVEGLNFVYANNKLSLIFHTGRDFKYRIYYTDWSNFNVPGKAETIFTNMVSTFSKSSVEFEPIITCP